MKAINPYEPISNNPPINDIINDFNRNGYLPVILTDFSCDYEPHSPYIASLDYDDYRYTRDFYVPRYNMTLTCGNPYILRRILEIIKETDFTSFGCEYAKHLNAQVIYMGRLDSKKDLPKTAEIGEVYLVNGEMYIYEGYDWDLILDSSQLYATNENEITEEKAECKMEIRRYIRKHKILCKC